MIELYFMSAVISAIGLWYKYNVANNTKHLTFRDKDWLIILLPVVNFIMMFYTIILIFGDVVVRLEDFFGDDR